MVNPTRMHSCLSHFWPDIPKVLKLLGPKFLYTISHNISICRSYTQKWRILSKVGLNQVAANHNFFYYYYLEKVAEKKTKWLNKFHVRKWTRKLQRTKRILFANSSPRTIKWVNCALINVFGILESTRFETKNNVALIAALITT